MSEFKEGIHFYYDPNGLMVLTAQYHLEKGYCCGNGCRHCPYAYISVPEPKRSRLLAASGINNHEKEKQ
ncbi:MAG TPA: DUF5522 domain-containing protein [Ferruginibacter sp.]|nr:DUF5522 domain-containing protein [Ferruginibacter sp.]HMP22372.1 DUF5522 domain-containing protein [Ferruginibacter sp.]